MLKTLISWKKTDTTKKKAKALFDAREDENGCLLGCSTV
jgi:hypothetical protein